MRMDTHIEDAEMIVMLEQALASERTSNTRTATETQQQIETRLEEMKVRDNLHRRVF